MSDEKAKQEATEKPVSVNPLLDEAKATAERLEKASTEANAQANRLEQLRSEQLLSGTAGVKTPTPESKQESPKEYRARIQKEIREGKYHNAQE